MYVSMLVGRCHVRTVKQCLLIRAQPEEGEYVGQYVHGCEQVNYHTHNTGRMHCVAHFSCLFVCLSSMASICMSLLVASIAYAIPMATISSSQTIGFNVYDFKVF